MLNAYTADRIERRLPQVSLDCIGFIVVNQYISYQHTQNVPYIHDASTYVESKWKLIQLHVNK